MNHLDYIRIRGLNGGDSEAFQGIGGGGTLTISEGGSEPAITDGGTTDLSGIIEALAPLTALENIGSEPVDLSGVVDALLPLSQLELLGDIAEKIDNMKYNDEMLDFGFLRVNLRGKTIEY